MRTVLTPTSLADFFDLYEQHPGSMPLAGGTDLLVKLRSGKVNPPLLLRLDSINELKEVRLDDDTLFIGPAATFSTLATHPLLLSHAPLLARAAATVGGPAVRNMGTIGGNLSTASPAGDSLPPLYLLSAEIELSSRHELQRIPLSQFISGPGKTAIKADEIISGIRIPLNTNFTAQRFEKVGRRRSLAISVVSFCGAACVAPCGAVRDARFAWGSIGPTVVRLPQLEDMLRDTVMDDETIRRAALIVSEGISPISDIRASADYRRSVSVNLLTSFLEGLRG